MKFSKLVLVTAASSIVISGATLALAQTASTTSSSTQSIASSTISNTTSTTAATSTNATSSTPATVSTSTVSVATCNKIAIDAQDNALIATYDIYATAVKNALQTHRDAVKAAWDVTDAGARRDALRAAEQALRDALRQAERDLRSATRAADRKFKTDARACRPQVSDDEGQNKDRGEHRGEGRRNGKVKGFRGDQGKRNGNQ